MNQRRRKHSVRVVLHRYQPPDREQGRPKGRYAPVPGLSLNIDVKSERSEARLWDTIAAAVKLFRADELIGEVEDSGHLESGS